MTSRRREVAAEALPGRRYGVASLIKDVGSELTAMAAGIKPEMRRPDRRARGS
jgi:hypothetical protein